MCVYACARVCVKMLNAVQFCLPKIGTRAPTWHWLIVNYESQRAVTSYVSIENDFLQLTRWYFLSAMVHAAITLVSSHWFFFSSPFSFFFSPYTSRNCILLKSMNIYTNVILQLEYTREFSLFITYDFSFIKKGGGKMIVILVTSEILN